MGEAVEGIKAGPGPSFEEPTFKSEIRRKTWQMTLKSGMRGGRGEARRVRHRRSQGRALCTEGMSNTVECMLHLNEVWWTEKSEKPPYLLLT